MTTGKEHSITRLCSILVDEHCRQVIGFCRSANVEVATLDELVDYAVTGTDASTDRKQKAIRFHHITLPKLAHADVLDYDSKRQEIRYSGHDDLESLLGQIRIHDSEAD